MRILWRYKVKIISTSKKLSGFPGGSDRKEPACNAGDLGLIPRLGRFPGGGHGNPLQYSCLENPMAQEHSWLLSRHLCVCSYARNGGAKGARFFPWGADALCPPNSPRGQKLSESPKRHLPPALSGHSEKSQR